MNYVAIHTTNRLFLLNADLLLLVMAIVYTVSTQDTSLYWLLCAAMTGISYPAARTLNIRGAFRCLATEVCFIICDLFM